MEKFTTMTANAAPLPLVNIDTDMNHSKTVFENDQKDWFGNRIIS